MNGGMTRCRKLSMVSCSRCSIMTLDEHARQTTPSKPTSAVHRIVGCDQFFTNSILCTAAPRSKDPCNVLLETRKENFSFDKTSYYDIWQAAVAVDAMCSRIGLYGEAWGFGKLLLLSCERLQPRSGRVGADKHYLGCGERHQRPPNVDERG